jgi:cell division protein FtsI (penicillin-binding protein 3)
MKRPARPKKKNLRQIAFTRFMFIVALFVLWMGGISVRLVHLQVTQHEWLKEQSQSRRENVSRTRMLRGTIYDRNQRALAMSVRVKTLYADPKEISDPDRTGRAVAKALKMDAGHVTRQIIEGKEANRRYVVLAKKLEEDVVTRINQALDDGDIKKPDLPNFRGLHWSEDQKRKYPYESLAAQVIGFSDADDEGRAGIEQSQEEILHGAVIKKLQTRDRLGRVYDETTVERDAPSDVVLTIDAGMQYITDEALKKGVQASNSRSGIAVVMNPKTGEILAMSNYPTFDPNTISEAAPEHISNKAVQAVYSPGSVFKIVTYGSGLEKRLFSPEDEIDSGNGTIEVGKRRFTDSHASGRISYLKAMAQSSNVCAIKTGMRVGKDDFFSMIRKMGFGSRTGIELPAETIGIVRAPERWNADSLASMSIGYEISVTALQMASAFATIANNGVRVQPHIIKEIRRSDEGPKRVTQPTQTQVVTRETATGLRTMLRQVVLTGTGRRAQLNGYTAAGKTGTAWKVNTQTKRVDPSKYMSSFIGMAPADDPEIVVAVVMDEPKGGARDGGVVSAPVFREIAQQILQSMNVRMDLPLKADSMLADMPSTMPSELPRESTVDDKTAADQRPAVAEKRVIGTDKPVVSKEKPKDKPDEKKNGEVKKIPVERPRQINSGTDKTKLET